MRRCNNEVPWLPPPRLETMNKVRLYFMAQASDTFQPFESFQRLICATRLFEHFAPDAKIPPPETRRFKLVLAGEKNNAKKIYFAKIKIAPRIAPSSCLEHPCSNSSWLSSCASFTPSQIRC